MKLIVGLGNPGEKYNRTRHNVGFAVLDEFAKKNSASFNAEKKFNAEIAEITPSSAHEAPSPEQGEGEEIRILLAKPQTFMNNSGEAVALLKNFYKISNEDILVVHDEVDLPFGTIRVSTDSGPAGHNGVKSIISAIGQDFTRIRIGAEGRESRGEIETEKFVLMSFTEDEQTVLEKEIIPEAIQKIQNFI